MTETKAVSDEIREHEHSMSREEARMMVDCVNFCEVLRRRKIFPDMDEISRTEIDVAALSIVASKEWQQAYLSQNGWLFKLGYIKQLDEKHYGETYYRLTGKDINQKEQARAEYIRLCSSSK